MKYTKPEMEIIVFREIDVVTGSTLVDDGISGGDEVDFDNGFQ